MSNQKWQEGETYQLRIETSDNFRTSNAMNENIFNLIGYKTFMVEGVDLSGGVTKLAGFSTTTSDILYWFNSSEIKYFDLVEHTEEKQEMTSAKTEQEIVLEWLGKLEYVMREDNSVSEELQLDANGGLRFDTDFTTAYGSKEIYEFIAIRHAQLKATYESKRKQELLDKRATLELELAQINKELGECYVSNI
jgi:hypothetical protein